MTTEEVLDKIREIIGRHEGSETELYQELVAEAEGWEMRLDELEYEASPR